MWSIRTYLLAVLVVFSICWTDVGQAGVLFSDDFESDLPSWMCGDGQLSKWSAGFIYCGHTEGFGYEWRMGPGHNSNNAVYAWKRGPIVKFRSQSNRWMSGAEVQTEIYHRWYMRWPSDLDKPCPAGFKFWRYILVPNGVSDPPEIYLEAHGNPLHSSNLGIYNVSTGHLPFTAFSNLNDNEWHCCELRIQLNSSGSASDGILQFWLDGNLEATYTNLSFADVDNMAIYRIGVGLGNVTEEKEWYNTEWRAAQFDDIVVSTDYVGPIGGGDGTTYYLDADGDGYSDGTSQEAESDPGLAWYIAGELLAISGDCDDGNATVNPGSSDPCKDCDAQTPCVPPESNVLLFVPSHLIHRKR